MIAYSREALDQRVQIPNPIKNKFMSKEVKAAKIYIAQLIKVATLEPIIDERETYFDFFRVPPNARKPSTNDNQHVKNVNPV